MQYSRNHLRHRNREKADAHSARTDLFKCHGKHVLHAAVSEEITKLLVNTFIVPIEHESNCVPDVVLIFVRGWPKALCGYQESWGLELLVYIVHLNGPEQDVMVHFYLYAAARRKCEVIL